MDNLKKIPDAELKTIQYEILTELDALCKKLNIRYSLCGGSLLGAVRHKAFIPWDDDIDIGMLRDDYDKFRKVCPAELQSHLSYQSHLEETTSHYIFDKVRLKDTYFNTRFSNRFDDIQNGIFSRPVLYWVFYVMGLPLLRFIS